MDNEIIKFECSPDRQYQYSVSTGYQKGLKEDQKQDGASNLIRVLKPRTEKDMHYVNSSVQKKQGKCTILLVHRL
jgi:hypothetical protein